MIIGRLNLEGTSLVEFPIFEGAYRAKFPLTQLPTPLKASDLEVGYVEVLDLPAPAPSRWQRAREIAPVHTNGQWGRAWVLDELPITIEQKQKEIKSDIEAKAAGVRSLAAAGTSALEAASWPIKRQEALAFKSTQDLANAPNLAAEATARGCVLADLVAKVLDKSAKVCAIEAQIAGRAGALKDQADSCTDSASLLAIDITVGWPL